MPGILALTSCITEVDLWLKHRRPTAWARNRSSLRAEVKASCGALGPRLAESLAPTLDRYRERLMLLTKRPRTDEIHEAAATGQSLYAAATTPDALRAAWRDLIDAVDDDDIPVDVVRMRHHQILALAGAAGHDVKGLSTRLRGVLSGSARGVMSARLGLGDVDPPTDWPGPREDADLSAEQLMILCSRLLGAPAESGRCISWHAFAPGQLDEFVLQLGRVTLLEARWAIPNMLNDDGQSFPGREELRDQDFHAPTEEMAEDEKAVILARVDLGNRQIAGALNLGRGIVRSLADIAAWEADGVRWREFGWEMLLVDGRARTSSSFVPKDVVKSWGDAYARDRTASALRERGAQLAAALANDTLPADLAEAVRSATEATSADLRSRVILNTRITEFVAAFAGRDAHDLVHRLCGWWPADQLETDMFNAIAQAVSDWPADADRRREQERIAKAVRRTGPGASFTIDLGAVADLSDELLELWSGTLLQRRLRWALSLLTDAQTYLTALEAYQRTSQLRQKRLQRVRNALTHGNPVHDAAVESVDSFNRYIANAALQLGLDTFATGSTVMGAIAAEDARRDAITRAIQGGQPLLSQLR